MMPIADARAQLSRFIDEATSTHERFEITRNGHRAAIHAGDYLDADQLAQSMREAGRLPR
jgi:antitoxin YefM